mgnify:CR=1 FL=1
MAVHFNADGGTDDSLTKTVSLFSGSSTSYNWSLVAWCRPDDRHEGTIIGADEGTGSNGRFSLFSRTPGRFAARRKSSYLQTADADYSNSNTSWFHVAGTWQYNLRNLYVNGVREAYEPGNKFGGGEAGTTNISLNPAKATHFYIGQDHSGKFWKGGIAEAAAYSVVLTAGEIGMLAAGFSPLMVRPESLIGYWPLGGAYPNDNMDIVGGNTLTTNGGPIAEPHPRIIYPSGPATYDFAAAVVEEEEPAAERGWVFESMQIAVGVGGRRRLSPPNTRTASTNKGWSLESLVVGVGGGGKRRK